CRMPASRISGKLAIRRSAASGAGSAGSEDRSVPLVARAWGAGWIHRQAAARAQRAARREHRLRLFRERDDLVGAEPEAHAGRIVRRAFFAGRSLACNQDEHAPVLVVPEAHLADLPLWLTRLEPRLGQGRIDALDALGRHHLLEPDDEGLDLRLLAGQGQRPARAAGEQEELALARLADRGDRDLVHGVELKNGHLRKTTGMWFRCRGPGEQEQKLTIQIRARRGAWRNRRCQKP